MCITIGYLIRKANQKKKQQEESARYGQSPEKPEYPNGQYATYGNGTVPAGQQPPPPNYAGQTGPMGGQQPMR